VAINISINISRLVVNINKDNIVLHGFSDASKRAYEAYVYIVYKSLNGKIATTLMCFKSRIPPLKVLSLPRLELCGMILLIRLMNKVLTGLNARVHGQVYWTDSPIVLAWIGSPARRWNTFVANRVGKIQSSTSPSK